MGKPIDIGKMNRHETRYNSHCWKRHHNKRECLRRFTQIVSGTLKQHYRFEGKQYPNGGGQIERQFLSDAVMELAEETRMKLWAQQIVDAEQEEADEESLF